ncbi:MAG: hypothetical protein Q4B16_04955 [Bacteroidia bacterium]|nr:hypothetical protein [Bacteroidia bacterium]
MNAGKIADNSRRIDDNAGDIAAAEALIDANSALIENNKTAIAANASAIASLQDKAAAADDAIAKNAADIAANAAAIAKNTIDIEFNTSNIAQCSAFILINRRNTLDNQHDIQDLKTALADQKTEITDAYTRAISAAITANNGTLDAKLQTEIGKVNDKIAALDIRLTAVENSVSSLTDRVDDIEEGLKSLTSIAYIPKYADGIERVEYEVSGYKFTRKGDLVLRFDVYPASAAQTIADSYATTLSARAVYTLLTRANAGDFIDLQIIDATATGGILTVTVYSSNLDLDFLVGNLEASLVLKVKAGYNNLQSAYIPLVATGENLSYAQYVLGSFDTDGDEDLSGTELAAITQMDLTRCEDTTALDLTVFPNLSKVNCPSLDWLRKLAPAYDVTTVFYSADGASRLYSEDDILIDGIVWQKKNVGASGAEELGVSASYVDALNSTCPEGYHLPWKAEFDALARNYSSLIKLTNVDGRWFSGSRVWSEGSDVPAIFLPGLQSLPFSRYLAYFPGGPSAVIPVFLLDDKDPSQRSPKGWWQNIQAYDDSNCTQIRCVKD